MIEPEHAVIGIIFFFLVCLVIYLLAIKTKKCRKCPHAGTTNCPACKVNNSQWIKMNGLDPKNPVCAESGDGWTPAIRV